MLDQMTELVARVRNKTTTELSFAVHSAFGWYARRSLRLAHKGSAETTAESLRTRGFAVIPTDARIQRFVESTYPELEKAWNAKDGTWRDPPTGGTYKIFLSEICERWPSVLELLDGDTAAMLEAYYGSHFRYSYVEPYRTLPAEGELPKSWLWHRDAVPPGVLKLMVYLNGATRETGALRVLDRAASREIDRLGFRSRADSNRMADEIAKREVALEGGPGTAVIIDNSVLHKATAPERGHRDVVCYQILPSLLPERVARTRARVSRSYAPTTPQHPFLPTSNYGPISTMNR